VNGYLNRFLAVCLLPALCLAAQVPVWADDAPSQTAPAETTATNDASAAATSEVTDGEYLVFDKYLERRGAPSTTDASLVTAPLSIVEPSPIATVADASQVETASFFTPMPSVAYPVDRYYLQVLPDGLIYKSYLAGVKESRMSAHLIERNADGFIWDATLGGRVGLLRWGNADPVRPAGWQIDAEGSAQLRLDVDNDVDVRSADYRAGILLTHGDRWQQTKFGYYHLSSHLGDEFLLKNPMFPRVNFARDVLVLGRSVYLTDEFRVYGEMGYAFYSQVSEPWEFQFGFDYAPAHPTGIAGAPFVAVNGHLREDVDFGGNLVVQGGWAWRGDASDNLLRAGIHYYNGESPQYSFFDDFEQQIGFGLWYDY